MTLSLPSIHTDGAVSAAAVLWRFRGRLQLTVVVKAVFAVVPDGVATPVGPGEIVLADRHLEGSSLRSLEAASDLAPYLQRCDVVFTGHAYAPGGGATSAAVRLGLSRGGQRLLDKTIHVYGDRGAGGAPGPYTRIPIVYERAAGGPGAPNPIGTDKPNLADPKDPRRPAGFGPIARLWLARRGALGSIDPRSLDGPGAEIPEAMPWAYFQAAPPDQQIDPLRGGEWLVLDGLHPTRPRVQTCLPAARGAARIEGRDGAAHALELVCDTLAIDGDRQVLALVWRGRRPIDEGEAGLASLTVLAALETPGAPVDWARVRASPPFELRAAEKAQVPLGETVSAAPGSAAASSKAALPFEPSGAPARPPSTEGGPVPRRARPKLSTGTLALPSMDPSEVLQRPVVPFPALAEEPTRGSGETPGAPWSRAAPPPPAPREGEADTADLEPLDPAELRQIEEAAAAPAPPPSLRTPLPPPPDPWARLPDSPPPAPPPPAPPPPPAFARPAAAAVKGSFYAKFVKR